MALTLQKRVVLTLVPLLALFLILGSAGAVLLYRLGVRVDAILRENFDRVVAMKQLDEALERTDSSFQFALAGRETGVRNQYEASWKAYRDSLRSQESIGLAGQRELMNELTALSERYEQQGKAFYALAAADPRRDTAYFDAGGLLDSYTRIKSVIGQIARTSEGRIEQASRDAHRTAAGSLVGFVIGLAVCMALAGFAVWQIFHAILAPISAMTQSARGICAGNFDQVVPYLSSDALGQLTEAFNRMARHLREERESTAERTKKLVRTAEALRTEISERERMEHEIRQMAAIVESSDDAIVSQDLDGTITSWNKGAERIFGYPPKSVLGEPQGMLVPPGHENELPAIRERILRGEHVQNFETVRTTKDGRGIDVSLTVSPVKDETGKVVGVASIARDITERKRADEALRRALAYNRRLLETSLDPMAAIGSDGKITDVNAAAEAATGRSRSELVGTDFADYFTEPEKAGVICRRVFGERAVRDYPLELRHRDGRVTPVLYNAAIFRDEDDKVVGVFAAARDVTNVKQAEEKIQRSALLQGVVAELGQRALQMEATANLLDEAVARMAETLDTDFCTVLELLPGGEQLLLRAGVGWKAGVVGHATIKAQGTMAGYVIHNKQPVVVNDTATETHFMLTPEILGEDVVSAMGSVIPTPDGPYGILCVHSRRRRTFTQDEVNFLRAVANVLGSAIQHKRSVERLRRSNRAHVALSNCNQTLVRATDETGLLQQICRIVVEEAGYRHCWVGYAEHDDTKSVRPVSQAGFEEGYLQTLNVTWADQERGRGPVGTCIRTGQTIVIKDIGSDERFAPWRAEALKRGFASCVGIPLIADSTTLGALAIYAGELNAFDDQEVKLLTELANDLAYGIMALRTKAERKKALELQVAREREIKIGSEIQQTLLTDPLPADLRGLRVVAVSVPSQQVDGDFYYCYKHEDHRVDLIIADVMGKGIPAALLGAATKSHFLEALSHLLDACPAGVLPQPREVVTLANAVMAAHLIDLESFVTVCYVRFDPGQRMIEFVDAGHTGLIHYRAATGRCEVLHGDNLPLGFRKGEIYNQQSVRLDSDDLVVLYSDGITETRNSANELFGTGRLMHCIESHSTIDPEDLATAIREAVSAFAEANSPNDDLTCVVIKVIESECPQRHGSLEIRSDFQELRRARAFVRDFCREVPGARPSEESIGLMELAVTEACTNIMKHAFHGRNDQQIQMEAESFPDRIAVRLYHLGDPFDLSTVPLPRFDGSQESGFGVYLINQCVDMVRYYRDERGRSCIALTKNR